MSSASGRPDGGVARGLALAHLLWLSLLLPLLLLLLLSTSAPTTAAAASYTAEEDLCPVGVTGERRSQERYFYYEERRLPIVLEDSDRISHRVTNRILKILLQNVAGYKNVEIAYCPSYEKQNITASLDRVSGRMASRHCQPPKVNTGSVAETMVNMEAWMTAGFNKAPWLDTGQLLDAGPLGPQGRLGWFVPMSVVDRFWTNGHRHIVDHWKTFTVPNLARRFSWWGRPELTAVDADFRQRAYRSPKCQENAQGQRKKCATLFAAYRDSGILESQIENLDLWVDIVWLEDHFDKFIKDQLGANEPILFFNWHPNTLIASGQFTRISFPETHRDHKDVPEDCDFPVNQLTKVLWGPIKTGAPEAYHIISHMTFTDLEYDHIIANASETDSYVQQLACHWVQHNRAKWEKWLPLGLTEKPKLHLAGLFPLTGNSWSQPGLVLGAKLAVELVNLDPNTLPNHTLELLVADTECQYDTAISRFISMVLEPEPPIVGILGTGCSDPAERIASLSKHFHMLMVSYGAEAQDLSDRQKYPYFFRTVPPVQHYTYVYPDLFKELGWDVVGALAEGGQEFPGYHLTLQDRLHHHGISLIVRRKFLNTTGTPGVREILQEFKMQNVRVIIADVFSNVAREIMCEAYKLQMTAHDGYVWFLPSWYPEDWVDVEYYNSEPNHQEAYAQRENVPCTSAQVEYAAQGHFVLSKAFTAPADTEVAGGISVNDYRTLYARRCGEQNVEESKFASFVYDAVWVYANGLHNLLERHPGALESLHTKSTADIFRAEISSLSFSGVSGWIKFHGSDRNSDLVILQVFSNETRQIGQFVPSSDPDNKAGLLHMDTSLIKWLSPRGNSQNGVEQGGEECPIESFRAQLGVSCIMASIMVIGMAFVGFIVIVIVFLILIKHRCDVKMRKLRAAHERIKELGLLNEEYSHILTVDDWEIPLKNVVVNRELGEGAFGTVMGGEMYKEGEGWVAVAVKTLKLHRTMQEKLDFFSEVDMMKGLSHQNIVQLWGVCTRKEPMYAVMEFLLHGDLKTYLLSRRSLVGQGVKEAEDVKAANLTQMAVDVALGLGYLHSLKFVHRDLACRNCLVHANKTVKIGDFGMTRHVSSTDYYRFSRRGMLPVRWTAPEALKDGIYSAKSDIWSFGVLVFEIVTFGSFPYQGLSNKEVLDYVSSGNQLILPDKCPADLKSFIHWCMSTDPGYRPDLDDIVSYLKFSPSFLTPCLDAPTTSVVHEDTDSLEMPLPDKSLGHSYAGGVEQDPAPSKHEKLGKKKTFSVLGLPSLSKSAKSSVNRRSPRSSRSSSVCTDTLHSASVCGLYSSMIGGNNLDEASGSADNVFRSRSCDFVNESELKEFDSDRGSRGDGSAIVCDGEQSISQQHSFGSDHKYLSSILSREREEESSGYLSQESKQICQTVTSL
ncbi:uncharacterized protein LOC101848348 [Aplysia californica]|uniref:Uncharacterized protein LOC101848348 n=1 Tax=Aplysia californica TaxID=6500 RepID=A0ABM0ZYJ9_APLCA|nr:uncharacterized protein LOC101848348 [Aplysia californica]